MKKLVFPLVIVIMIFALAGCSLSGGGGAKDGFPYDSLESDSVKGRDGAEPITLDGERLGELLTRMAPPEAYTWTCRVTYSSEEDSVSYTIVKQVSEGRVRCDKYSENGTHLMYSEYAGGSLYVCDVQTGESLTRESFDGDYLGSTVNLSDPVLILKSSRPENISDITFGYEGADAVISFEYKDPAYGFSEKYELRASDGIPIRVESTAADRVIYTLETVDVEYFVSEEGAAAPTVPAQE